MCSESENSRLISLDAFRGVTIGAMILVNSPGTYRAVYPQLMHAEWNGWSLADCVFPFFLFILGVTSVLSIAKRKAKGGTDLILAIHVLKRSLVLFGLGLFIAGYPHFYLSTLRIPGVLQRVAVCYLIVSFIVLTTSVRTQVLLTLSFLAFYWLIMQFVPVPGVGAGLYEPGRNFAAYIDSLFLKGHMWRPYQPWDPEGIVSTIPAVATTLFGALTGHCLRSSVSAQRKTIIIFFLGLMLVSLGLIFDNWLPINKNLWTSSFCLFMSGLAMICLAVFYWLNDYKQFKRWVTPFVILGLNPIAVYVLSQILDKSLRTIRLVEYNGLNVSLRAYIYRHLYAPFGSPMNTSLLFAASFVLLIFLVAWIMWKKGWFIKV